MQSMIEYNTTKVFTDLAITHTDGELTTHLYCCFWYSFFLLLLLLDCCCGVPHHKFGMCCLWFSYRKSFEASRFRGQVVGGRVTSRKMGVVRSDLLACVLVCAWEAGTIDAVGVVQSILLDCNLSCQ